MTPDWLRLTPIAHRGLHRPGVPENSLAAFEAAILARFAIELDVRMSADDEPIVFHDETLDRLTGTEGRLDERTTDQLRSLRLTGSDEPIATLREVLDRVGGRTPILVEVKPMSRAAEQRTAGALAGRPGPFAVQSFDPFAVSRLRRLLPGVACGLLAGPAPSLAGPRRLAAERLLLAPWVLPDFIAYDVTGSCRWARRVASMLGVPLILWTVRNASDRAEATALGANIIFESV